MDRVTGGLSFDPQTATSAYLALTLTCLGYIDRARSRMDEAVSEARRVGVADRVRILAEGETMRLA